MEELLKILRLRLAKGEITKEEYEELKKTLEGSPQTSTVPSSAKQVPTAIPSVMQVPKAPSTKQVKRMSYSQIAAIVILIFTVFLGILYQTGTLNLFIPGISPARDLTGRWIDLQGEGLVVTPWNGPHRFHYDCTMDIVQSGNTFTGTMYTSLWNAEALVPYSIWVDDGCWNLSYPGPVQTYEITDGVISGVNIQFQIMGWMTFKGTFISWSMNGTVEGYDASTGIHYSGMFTLRKE